MYIFRHIYEATTKELSDFKNIHKYTSYNQILFDKILNLLTEIYSYIQKSIKTNFQDTMLINIGTNYLALISVIKKDWKNKTTNLAKTVLQIIRYFEFINGNEKTCNVMQILSSIFSTNRAPKDSCKNPECLKKGLTTDYTNHC